MDSVTIHVTWGNPDTCEPEDVHEFSVCAQKPTDWAEFKGVQAYKSAIEEQWVSTQSPTGEVIEVMAVFSADRGGFVMHVRQDKKAVAQVICQSLSSFFFRTLNGEAVGIEVHPSNEG